ncbi:hypothetical protein ABIE91_000358 [Bradyrhizobium elkanii]
MIKSPMMLAAFLTAPIILFPPQTAIAAGGGGGGGGGGDPYGSSYGTPAPSYPQQKDRKTTHKVKKPVKQSGFEDPAFRDGYRAAYATIYEHNDYAAAIDQLHALGRDDHPNVANLIGYSYRKLGDYKQSQVWSGTNVRSRPIRTTS